MNSTFTHSPLSLYGPHSTSEISPHSRNDYLSSKRTTPPSRFRKLRTDSASLCWMPAEVVTVNRFANTAVVTTQAAPQHVHKGTPPHGRGWRSFGSQDACPAKPAAVRRAPAVGGEALRCYLLVSDRPSLAKCLGCATSHSDIFLERDTKSCGPSAAAFAVHFLLFRQHGLCFSSRNRSGLGCRLM